MLHSRGIFFFGSRRRPFDKSFGLTARVVDAVRESNILLAAGIPLSNFGRDGDHIQISPPFVINELEVNEIVDALDNALRDIARDLPAAGAKSERELQ